MLNDLTALWNARLVALGLVTEQDTKKYFFTILHKLHSIHYE